MSVIPRYDHCLLFPSCIFHMKRIQEINKVTANITNRQILSRASNFSPLTFLMLYVHGRKQFWKKVRNSGCGFFYRPKPYLNCWSLKDQFYGSRTSKITCATTELYVGLFFFKKCTKGQMLLIFWIFFLSN